MRRGHYDLDISPCLMSSFLEIADSFISPDELRIYQYLEKREVRPVNLQDFITDKIKDLSQS